MMTLKASRLVTGEVGVTFGTRMSSRGSAAGQAACVPVGLLMASASKWNGMSRCWCCARAGTLRQVRAAVGGAGFSRLAMLGVGWTRAKREGVEVIVDRKSIHCTAGHDGGRVICWRGWVVVVHRRYAARRDGGGRG
jgi:hypothetical protein